MLHPSSKLSLRELTLKLTMSIALLSAQRCQTIHALNINSMKVEVHPTQQYVFQVNQLLKTSWPGKHFSHLVMQSYPDDKQLCVCEVLQVYLEITKPLRDNCTLLISYQKPHQPMETIARWLRMVLDNSGIDTTAFGAATSAAKCAKLSVNTMMSGAGWANASTFSKFYDKPIIPDTVENFGHALLKSIHVA